MVDKTLQVIEAENTPKEKNEHGKATTGKSGLVEKDLLK